MEREMCGEQLKDKKRTKDSMFMLGRMKPWQIE